MGLRSDSRLYTSKMRQLIDTIATDISSPPPPIARAFLRLKRRIEQQDLADKGETLNNKKVLDFLHTLVAAAVHYTNSPSTINPFGQSWTKNLEFLAKRANHSTPLLLGQFKLHKTSYPIRPVIAYYTDPSYRLSKYLASWFRETANFTS